MAPMVEPLIINNHKDVDSNTEDNNVNHKSKAASFSDDSMIDTARKDDPENEHFIDSKDDDNVTLDDKLNENEKEAPSFCTEVTEEVTVENSSKQEKTDKMESRIKVIHSVEDSESRAEKLYEISTSEKDIDTAQTEKDYSQDNSISVPDSVNSSEINSIEKSRSNEAPHNKSGNDEDSMMHKSSPKRYSHILDSDSEDERTFPSSLQKKTVNTNLEDSDSRGSNNSDLFNSTRKSKKKKAKRVVRSDSEDSDVVRAEESSDEGGENEQKRLKQKKRRTIINRDSDEDSNLNGSEMDNIHKSGTTKKLNDLWDSESEEDGRVTPHHDSSQEQEDSGKSRAKKKEKGEKKKTGSLRASKDEAMRKIRSETQRLLREAEISLPYHRPKQRSLQEFLNRSRTVPKLPVALTAAARVKMSSELVGKVLEEKAKEAELFYKSSSDSESEEPISKLPAETPSNIEIQDNPISVSTNIENICIEETQKLTKNDVQNANNKKEIIKQGAKDLGVPRKLFDHAKDELEEREMNGPNEENESGVDPQKKNREYKEGLKDVSVPRKLFGTDFDEPMDTDSILPDLQRKKKDGSIDLEENQADSGIQSASNNTLIESLDDKINVQNNSKRNSGQIDCSMENDTEDFVLKMSEDAFDCTENIEMANEQTIKKVIDPSGIDEREFADINETPILRKTDTTQLKDQNERVAERESCQSNSKDFNNLNGMDEEPKDTECTTAPIGDVLGLPLPEFDDEKPTVKPKSAKKRILPNFMNMKPMLAGSPDMVIDLSESVKPDKSGVNGLLDRFFKHSITKTKVEGKADVTVIHTEQTVDGLKVVKEVIPYKLPADEKNEDPELSKPGAKLTRLREELKQKMASKRTEEWKQKEREMKVLEEDMYGDGTSDGEIEDEEELEEELSESGESEPEEDDMPIKETKKKTKSPFVDEEADESDAQEDEADEEISNEEDEDEKKTASRKEEIEEGESDSNEEEDESDHNSSDEQVSDAKNPGRLKRIVKAFEDDSNDAETKQSENDSNKNSKNTLQRTRTDVDMFEMDRSNDAWSSDTEADLPAYQPRNPHSDGRSQVCKTPLATTNSLSFVSPVTQLTVLNTSLGSARKDNASNMDYSPQITAVLSIENTPVDKKSFNICHSEKRVGLQKKLFDDAVDVPNDEELMALCSGRFTGTESDDRGLAGLIGPAKEVDDPETELLGLCSGAFDTQRLDFDKLEGKSTQVPKDESGDMRLTLEDESGSATQKQSNVPRTVLKIASSSSEDEEEAAGGGKARKKNLKKKVRKLVLSDEEGSDSEDLSDADEEFEKDNDELNFVDYDSEENEVVVVPNKDLKKVAANFLDGEAELSESEWGSADEDEKGLDKLEYEEGDDEDIDEDKMKDQLDKIHMRQVLDEDQRNVRMLQEMLFEDGDLHSDSSGRQRQFKWKNIDKLGEDGEVNPQSLDDDDASMDMNDESELEWRKFRHEREKFLEEQKKEKPPTDNIEDDLADSQIFKLGMKALKKSKHNQTQSQEISSKTVAPVLRPAVSDLPESPATAKKSITLTNALQRGSFLARGEETLARLAAMTKLNNNAGILGPKKSRNFVFAHLSPAGEAGVRDDEDSEARQDVPNNMSRKRKPTSGTTPTLVKKFKTEGDRNKGKKLF